jgi:hypothetical protein
MRESLLPALSCLAVPTFAQQPGGPHASEFEPDPEPTLEAGVKAMIAVAISLLK